jgi:hypothetical protein
MEEKKQESLKIDDKTMKGVTEEEDKGKKSTRKENKKDRKVRKTKARSSS